jgi:flagellar hook-associated protein 1 FlgK
MSLASALQNALTGLQVNQRALALTSANVTNANSPDYHRRILQRESIPQPLGGVQTTEITRIVNDNLRKDVDQMTSSLGTFAAQDDYLSRLKDIFGISSGTTALSSSLSRFSDSWRVYESAPESAAASRDVISLGKNFTQNLRDLSAGIESMDADIRLETDRTVATLNDHLSQFNELNMSIVRARALGEDVQGLEDQREAAVRDIAKLTDVRSFMNPNGRLSLFTSSGMMLVDTTAVTFAYDGMDITISGQPGSVNAFIRGGRIAGLLALRADSSPANPDSDPGTEVIRKLRDQLEALAAEFLSVGAGSFGNAYNSAATQAGELAAGFFTGTGRFDLAVNANLLNGSMALKQAAARPAGDAMADQNRTFIAGGLSLTGVSYAGMAQNIIGALGDDATRVADRHDNTQSVLDATSQRYQSVVGVNMDEELANMQLLQNAYAASARILSVVDNLYQELLAIGR